MRSRCPRACRPCHPAAVASASNGGSGPQRGSIRARRASATASRHREPEAPSSMLPPPAATRMPLRQGRRHPLLRLSTVRLPMARLLRLRRHPYPRNVQQPRRRAYPIGRRSYSFAVVERLPRLSDPLRSPEVLLLLTALLLPLALWTFASSQISPPWTMQPWRRPSPCQSQHRRRQPSIQHPVCSAHESSTVL